MIVNTPRTVPNGMNMWAWTPAAAGANFEMTRILEPLAPFRQQMLVLSGMVNLEADERAGEAVEGPHKSQNCEERNRNVNAAMHSEFRIADCVFR